jgi:hypothetical protein
MGVPLHMVTRVIRAFVWVFAAVVLLELVARIGSGVFLFSIDNLIVREISPLRWASGPFIFDDKLGWRLKPRQQYPGQGGRPDGKLSIGAFGLRGASVDSNRVPQQAILAVGEAHTLGINVDDAETWPAQLGSMRGDQVLNGSSWEWGFDQIVLRAEELVPRLRPKTLLIGLRPNAVMATDYKLFGLGYKPYFDVVEGKLTLAGAPVRLVGARDAGWPQYLLGYSQLVNKFFHTRAGSWIVRKVLHRDWVEYSKRAHADDESQRISCLLADRLAALKRQYDMRVVVVIEHGAAELLAPPSSESWLIDCIRDNGLEVVDTDQTLRVMVRDDRQAFRKLWQGEGESYGPPNGAGGAFVAGLVNTALSR